MPTSWSLFLPRTAFIKGALETSSAFTPAAEKQRIENQQALTQEATLIDMEEEPSGELKFTRVEEVTPEMTSGKLLGTETMQPVSLTGSYREPKLGVLLGILVMNLLHLGLEVGEAIT